MKKKRKRNGIQKLTHGTTSNERKLFKMKVQYTTRARSLKIIGACRRGWQPLKQNKKLDSQNKVAILI